MARLAKIQEADLKNKTVLIRVDHNVVKKGKIKDEFRIEASMPTVKYVLEKGGKPILMTHVGRPRDKQTGKIEISENTSVRPVAEYIARELGIKVVIPDLKPENDLGLQTLDIKDILNELHHGMIDLIYLPNTRWFTGEETRGEAREKFAADLSGLADLFVNDAFGSWQPHTSTIEPAKSLPAYAGLLMQKEVENLSSLLSPERPFLAVVAGAKFDTKIGPLESLLEKADHLILGGIIYNAYLCAKYGIRIEGVEEEDIKAAADFVATAAKYPGRIIELPFLVESDVLEERSPGKYRSVAIDELRKRNKINFILDVDPESFRIPAVEKIFRSAATIFINAVMGYTPNFGEGSKALYSLIDKNKSALKLFGGGDTLQDFKLLLPDIFAAASKDPGYYFFTGGGAILKAIEEGEATGMEPVRELLV